MAFKCDTSLLPRWRQLAQAEAVLRPLTTWFTDSSFCGSTSPYTCMLVRRVKVLASPLAVKRHHLHVDHQASDHLNDTSNTILRLVTTSHPWPVVADGQVDGVIMSDWRVNVPVDTMSSSNIHVTTILFASQMPCVCVLCTRCVSVDSYWEINTMLPTRHDHCPCPSKQLLSGARRRRARSLMTTHRCGRTSGWIKHCVTLCAHNLLHCSDEAKSVVSDTDHQRRCATLQTSQALD